MSLRVLGGVDVGVVIDTLPEQQRFHLVVATGRGLPKVTLLSKAEAEAEVLKSFTFDEDEQQRHNELRL